MQPAKACKKKLRSGTDRTTRESVSSKAVAATATRSTSRSDTQGGVLYLQGARCGHPVRYVEGLDAESRLAKRMASWREGSQTLE